MSWYGPGGWGWGPPGGGGGGWQPGYGYGQPGFGGRGPAPPPQPAPPPPGGNPGTAQPLPASQDPNSAFYGTPFAPDVWPLGRFATVGVDVPIMITFAVIFFLAMIIHFASMFINAAKGHKVFASFLLVVFCAARTAGLGTRTAGAYLGYDGDLYIAGYVLTFAAPPLLYFVNLIFAHRVIRLQHPIIGRWNPILYALFIFVYILMVISWAFLLAGLLIPFYWRQPHLRNIALNFRRYAFIVFAITAGLPILLVITSSLIPRIRRHKRYSHIGMAIKIIILLIATTLATAEAVFLTIIEWKRPVSRNDPPPKYTGRIFYYVLVFVLEIIIVYLYAVSRVDQRVRGARYDREHSPRRRDSRASRASRDSRVSHESYNANRPHSSTQFATGAAEKPPKGRMFGLLPPKADNYDNYPRNDHNNISHSGGAADDYYGRGRDRSSSRERSDDERRAKKGGFGARLRKYGLALTGGAAAGAFTAGAVKHRRRKRRSRGRSTSSSGSSRSTSRSRSRSRERSRNGHGSRSRERTKSVAWVDELDKREAQNRDGEAGYNGRHHDNTNFSVPRKEMRTYDDAIPEESEIDDSSDSLYGPGSSIQTDDKPMSPASTLVEERERPRPRSAMRDIGQRAEMRDRSTGRRTSL